MNFGVCRIWNFYYGYEILCWMLGLITLWMLWRGPPQHFCLYWPWSISPLCIGLGRGGNSRWQYKPTAPNLYKWPRITENPYWGRVTGKPLIIMSCNPQGETTLVACVERSLPRVERALYLAPSSLIINGGSSIRSMPCLCIVVLETYQWGF